MGVGCSESSEACPGHNIVLSGGEVRENHRLDPCPGVSVIIGKTGHGCKKIISNNKVLQ